MRERGRGREREGEGEREGGREGERERGDRPGTSGPVAEITPGGDHGGDCHHGGDNPARAQLRLTRSRVAP